MKGIIRIDYLTDFRLQPIDNYKQWVKRVLDADKFLLGELQYVFVDDAYLYEINKKYLSHNTYTDIITFDYSTAKVLSGDIFISVERVKENAISYTTSFDEELLRVMIHGVLHLMGYKDSTVSEKETMRKKETECIQLFHVER